MLRCGSMFHLLWEVHRGSRFVKYYDAIPFILRDTTRQGLSGKYLGISLGPVISSMKETENSTMMNTFEEHP